MEKARKFDKSQIYARLTYWLWEEKNAFTKTQIFSRE